VFGFSLHVLSETFLILRRNERDIAINTHRSSCEEAIILSYFYENRIFSKDLKKKYSNFHENRFTGSRVVSRERTDGRTGRLNGTNNSFSQFCERILI
jgi:hypothetical protein